MKAHTGSLDESLRTIPYCALRYYEALLELVYLVLCTGLLVLRGTDWQLLWSMQPFDTQIVKYSLVFLCVESALWGLGWFCLCCSCTARDRLARNQYLEVLDVCLLCVLIGCAVWGLVLLTLSETGLHVNWALSCLIDYARGGALGLGLLLRFLHLALHNLGLLSSFTLEETGKTSLAHSYHVAESIGAIGSRPGAQTDSELLQALLPNHIYHNRRASKADFSRLSLSGGRSQQHAEFSGTRDATERSSTGGFPRHGPGGSNGCVPRSAVLCLLREEATLVWQFLGEWVLSAGAAVSASSVAALIDVLMGSIAGQLAWRLPSPLWISFPWPVAALAAALVARATLGAASHLGLSRLQAKLHGALGARASATAWGAAAASPRVLSALIREVLAPCAWLASAVSAMLAFSPDHALALALCATAAASLGGCAESPTSQLGARIRVAVCQAVGIVTVAALACVNLTTESRKEVIAAETVASCLLMAHLGDTISALRRGSRLIVAAACDAFEDDQLC
mmetsp:Transcript_40521/g.96296  ORF Transcript_40521/g.96296 Transcript_40521/m.96296 type:complete len:512 (-) Transcript_40521:350-1885(-)